AWRAWRSCFLFFFQAEDGIRDLIVTGVQTCALPISRCARSTQSNHHGHDLSGGLDSSGRTRRLVDWTVYFEHSERGPILCPANRSEERRVGKEWRSRWSP